MSDASNSNSESSQQLSPDEARMIIKAIEEIEKEEAAELERQRKTDDSEAGVR